MKDTCRLNTPEQRSIHKTFDCAFANLYVCILKLSGWKCQSDFQSRLSCLAPLNMYLLSACEGLFVHEDVLTSYSAYLLTYVRSTKFTLH